MKSRFLIAAVAFLGYAIIDGPAANAQVYFDNNDDMGDGLWSTDTNWSATDCNSGADGVPGSGDHAIICADLTVTVDDTAAEAQKVTVRNGSMIDIRPANGADATLTLGDGNNQTSTLVGTIDLNTSPDTTQLGTLFFVASENHTFTRTTATTGSIVGHHSNGRLDVPNTSTAIISSDATGGDVRLRGKLQVTGAGAFTNNGRVVANVAGTLDFLITGTISDNAGSSRWKVESDAGAVLRFRVEPAALAGGFVVSEGELRAGIDPDPSGDDIDVCTTGNLSQTDGQIIALVGDSFKFGGTCN